LAHLPWVGEGIVWLVATCTSGAAGSGKPRIVEQFLSQLGQWAAQRLLDVGIRFEPTELLLQRVVLLRHGYGCHGRQSESLNPAFHRYIIQPLPQSILHRIT
jgi:hypothetical protein